MELLKAQLARLQQQFNQLTASQKMLSVALVAIMVMTLTLWGRYAGQAEFEPVIDQDFAAEDLARITADLRGRQIPFTTQGARILVPADRKYEVLGDLVYQQLLPKDMSSAFNDIFLKNDNVLGSPDRSDRLHTEARQAMLAQVIKSFPKVRDATVLIDNTRKRSFDQPVNASASVYVHLKNGEKADNRLCNAAADVVCGAVAGLKRKDVKVVVDGVSRALADDSGEDGAFAGGTWMDTVRESEGYYAKQIYDHFAYCEGVLVHVSCRPKSESSETKETKYDAKGAISKEVDSETESSNSSGGGRGASDPGVAANTGSNKGMAIGDPGGAAGDGSNTTEHNRTKSENFVPRQESVKRDPAGSIAVTSASVALPRSFFVKAYKTETGTDKDPGPAVLDTFVKLQLEKLKAQVKACVSVQADDAVVVDTYPDLVPAVEAPTQAASGVSLMLGSHAKEIALGALALVSLFMVSMMVRKSAPAVATSAGAVAVPEEAPGQTVDAALAKAGMKPSLKFNLTPEEAAEVGEGGRTLDGVELDDETVRAQQVIDQVSAMVKENPDAAANLVKRWMSRS
jgi:flagellar biosynthesis/type III secretory pathway M-ring protein FliF/YscJ